MNEWLDPLVEWLTLLEIVHIEGACMSWLIWVTV
jgi:hypothetical protein